jgi:curved DNA-binding protein CbpA
VRRAYRDLARQYHPDLNPSPDATAKMQAINQAYQQIMDQFEE